MDTISRRMFRRLHHTKHELAKASCQKTISNEIDSQEKTLALLLSISCGFLGNFAKMACWHPPPEGWRPLLGEVLDPPLKTSANVDFSKCLISPQNWLKLVTKISKIPLRAKNLHEAGFPKINYFSTCEVFHLVISFLEVKGSSSVLSVNTNSCMTNRH